MVNGEAPSILHQERPSITAYKMLKLEDKGEQVMQSDENENKSGSWNNDKKETTRSGGSVLGSSFDLNQVLGFNSLLDLLVAVLGDGATVPPVTGCVAH